MPHGPATMYMGKQYSEQVVACPWPKLDDCFAPETSAQSMRSLQNQSAAAVVRCIHLRPEARTASNADSEAPCIEAETHAAAVCKLQEKQESMAPHCAVLGKNCSAWSASSACIAGL